MPIQDSRWINRNRPLDKPRLRLFCLPHAGAGAVIFRDWHRQLPGDVEVCAIEPPGRLVRRREAAPPSLQAFAEELDRALSSHLDVPFAVFGYSLGAIMAFEWLRALRARGGPQPAHLIVAACAAPHRTRRLPPLSHLSQSDLFNALESRYGAFEPALRSDARLLEIILGIMRSDLRLLENYDYREQAPLDCPILSLGGKDDECVNWDELTAWQTQTIHAFRSRLLPGGHFFMRERGPELCALVTRVLTSRPATSPDARLCCPNGETQQPRSSIARAPRPDYLHEHGRGDNCRPGFESNPGSGR